MKKCCFFLLLVWDTILYIYNATVTDLIFFFCYIGSMFSLYLITVNFNQKLKYKKRYNMLCACMSGFFPSKNFETFKYLRTIIKYKQQQIISCIIYYIPSSKHLELIITYRWMKKNIYQRYYVFIVNRFYVRPNICDFYFFDHFCNFVRF